MLRFDWSAFVTEDVIAEVASAANVDIAAVTALRPLLARLMATSGGLPFIEREPTLAQRTERGLSLFSQAVAHTLVLAGVPHCAVGVSHIDSGNPVCEKFYAAVTPVAVNQASAQELVTLPGVTSAIVDAILVERRRGGPYSDRDDFERRVDGIGPVKAQALAGYLQFNALSSSQQQSLDRNGQLKPNLRTLLALQPDSEPTAALARALDAAITQCAGTPHPLTRDGKLYADVPVVDPGFVNAEWIGELWGEDYVKALPVLLQGAKETVIVCMFHIAAASSSHPTFKLLQALVDAHQRGVTVRVLVDSDTKSDPYRSSVINAHALRFLREAGVDCRSDASPRLLHSKYLVVDRKLVILGSHNWSAGSYFEFDDLTMVVASRPLSAQLEARFENQWAHGR
jgi:hypothetical protein